ncbi:hypothetical protein ES703_47519 [subsurface metagenome]
MKVIYHPETETVEIPVALVNNFDKRLALLQGLFLLLKLLIDDMGVEEQSRRRRQLWPTN